MGQAHRGKTIYRRAVYLLLALMLLGLAGCVAAEGDSGVSPYGSSQSCPPGQLWEHNQRRCVPNPR